MEIEWSDLSATASLSILDIDNGVLECHAMIQLSNPCDNAETQYWNIEVAITRCRDEFKGYHKGCPDIIFKRYFVSDVANAPNNWVTAHCSIVQQPPLNGTKVAAWVYFISGTPSYKHLFHTQLQKPLANAGLETTQIFEDYTQLLRQHHCTLKDNCLRTWIYVQGVDIHYAAMAKARAACFEKEGLTRATHYIASTGIEGRHFDPQSLVLMDAYAVHGIAPEQIRYLHAPTHLNPTYEYGVTFERGTTVDYGDRRHIFISGTASINNKGEIACAGDVEAQATQTMANIQALLSEAEADMSDVCQMIVYLRDLADYSVVADYFERHYDRIPQLIVLAPVCRTGWLIEVECVAATAIDNEKFKKF